NTSVWRSSGSRSPSPPHSVQQDGQLERQADAFPPESMWDVAVVFRRDEPIEPFHLALPNRAPESTLAASSRPHVARQRAEAVRVPGPAEYSLLKPLRPFVTVNEPSARADTLIQ